MKIHEMGSLNQIEGLERIRSRQEVEKPTDRADSFFNVLNNAVETSKQAQEQTQGYAAGTHQNIHETMIAMQKADIALTFLVNVRNKLLDAYREVMRMS